GGDAEHVLSRPEVADAAHDLDAERHRTILALEPLAKLAELFDDGGERVLARPLEQEAGVEHDRRRSRSDRQARRMVEPSHGRPVLLVALAVPHEPRDGCVQRQGDPCVAGKVAEPLGKRVAHPEPTLAVDFARGVAAFLEERDGLLGAFAGGNTGRADADCAHEFTLAQVLSDGVPTLFPCPNDPLASSCSSSTSTSGSPISGARRMTSPTGTSRSWLRSCARPTARGTATR